MITVLDSTAQVIILTKLVMVVTMSVEVMVVTRFVAVVTCLVMVIKINLCCEKVEFLALLSFLKLLIQET